MASFCVRCLFYSAWLYMLTLMRILSNNEFKWLEFVNSAPTICIFVMLSLLVSFVFSGVYVFSSHNITYEDFEVHE